MLKKVKNPKVWIPEMNLSENCATIGNKSYSTSNLIRYCQEKKYPVFKMPLAGINLNISPWEVNNIFDFIYHANRVNKTDLKYPIILNEGGGIADGWHRVIKAILEGKTEIDAIRIEEMPSPDGYINE